mmetsp:Transcript_50174/g.119460  ORF Transcript_50174/g.119460 Transcript_50174/m.119460 type:complete len:397 (-) Transcript_50174:241-1431(-)
MAAAEAVHEVLWPVAWPGMPHAQVPSEDSAAARVISPAAQCSKQWIEVLERQDLIVAICELAGGPPSTRHLTLTAVCRGWNLVLQKAWEELNKSFAPRLYVVAGLDGEFGSVDSAVRFDPSTKVWEALPGPGISRAAPAAAALVGRLYVVGGEANGEASRDVRRFDPWTEQWEVLPQMHVGRIRPAAVAHGGFLYVVGGHDGFKLVDSVERYSPRSRTWEILPAMNKPRYSCAASVYAGKLIVVGGELAEQANSLSVECYDLDDGEALGQWEIMHENLKQPCCGSSVAIADGVAYSLGGLSMRGQVLKDASMLSLESMSNTDWEVQPWSEMPPMQTPRHLASVGVFNGGAVAVGGKGFNFRTVPNVEVFCRRSWSWEVLAPLPWPRFRAAVAGGRL